ncbi:MAG: exodeoxyribonuclease VII small subunit [Microthrixaceae bacterium]|nr:exodeoxyribonuclease VII small subunit [Microthrixaceae bacterium]MCO5311643.1 exodeoxyribonuclease VII small subunit [Microthrixaceae bacterium]HPB44401.1 exodeoxyribonuclease VII small subunit [Microthrixaceae bacterium]
MTTTSPPSSGSSDESIGYVDAMAELEAILAELDRPDVDIDILADRVERASQLVSLCRERLERARLRVTEIVADLETDD